mmetsp:Transcript_101928/g.186713  ORF Transcript_101928/g.186713 Transcript_101928/m.186713 type:complete len:221 (-) Transcript_101928:64-726(-)
MVSLIEPRFQFIGSTFLRTYNGDEPMYNANDPIWHIQDVLGRGARVRRHSWSYNSCRHQKMMDTGLKWLGDDRVVRLAACVKERERLRMQASDDNKLARHAEGLVTSFRASICPPLTAKQAVMPVKTARPATDKLRRKVNASHALQLVAQFMEESTHEEISMKDVELQHLWSIASTPESPQPRLRPMFFECFEPCQPPSLQDFFTNVRAAVANVDSQRTG